MTNPPEKPPSPRGNEVDPGKVVDRLVREFMRDFRNLSPAEHIKRISEIIFAATIGRFMGKGKETVKQAKAEAKNQNNPESSPPNTPEKTEPPKEPEKGPDLEELAKIPDKGERVVKIAERMVKDKVMGKHCWDWVDKVYKTAKCQRRVIFSTFNKYEGKDCKANCANEEQLSQMSPGDHIFVNNKNKHDTHGNHSVIFLGWVNRAQKIARVASYPAINNRPPLIHERDLNKQPVTYIAKPV